MMSGSPAESGANGFRFAKLGAPAPKPPASQKAIDAARTSSRHPHVAQQIDRDRFVRDSTDPWIWCTNFAGPLLNDSAGPPQLSGRARARVTASVDE